MATKKKPPRKAASKKTAGSAKSTPKGPPKTIDELIARAAPEQRPALESLRHQIHSVVPGAVECISYGQAGFRVGGKAVVWFGAAKKHVSLFPGAVVERFAGRDDAADAGVPVRRPHVLRRRSEVDEDLAAAVEDQDVGAPMRQPARAHLATRRLPDDAAVVVDDVDQVVAGVERH